MRARSVTPASAAGGSRVRLRPPSNRLYAIVDTGSFGAERPAVTDACRTLLDCGVRWIQIRAKGLSDLQAWRLAEAVVRLVEEVVGGETPAEMPAVSRGDRREPAVRGTWARPGRSTSGKTTPREDSEAVHFWINDRAAIAAALPPAPGLRIGLHLGQDDLPPAVARLSVPRGCAIGRSTHSRSQAAEAEDDPAVDALAIGPVFGTTTKERPDPVVGLAGVAKAREVSSKPLIGIGGIDAEGAPRVIEAGADAVAVVSALDLGNLAASCRRLLRALA